MPSMKTALVISSRLIKTRSRWKYGLCCLPALATALCASTGLAAVPAVVADAQQTIGTNFSNSQSIAVAPNGTVYVADTNNNRIVQMVTNLPGTSTQTTVPTPALTSPQSVAVDSSGNLYIGDVPFFGLTARVTEIFANSAGAITGGSTSKTLYSGGLFNEPISLAVSSSNTLFIGDVSLGAGALYYIPSGGTLHTLNVTGLPNSFTPSALAVSGNNLFIANSSSNSGGIYVAPTSGGTAKPVLMGSFITQQPQGLAVDASGDLFVLAQLATGPNGNQVLEIPGASAVNQSAPYIIPSTNLIGNGGLALDPQGNLDVVGYTSGFFSYSGQATQLNFLNPVYLGAVNVYQNGTGILFNFEFNASNTFSGLRAITVGDLGSNSDVVQASGQNSGNCQTQKLTGLSATQPYTCYQDFDATPQYVGTRVSSIQVKGSGSGILNSSAVYELGDAAAQIAYPLDVTMTPLGLIQPQGIAVSGFNQTVYIADFLSSTVYSIGGLNGSKTSTVSTGSIALSAPSAVAMNGRGDLYIADFNLGEVVVVPTTTGSSPAVLNTGGLLHHPISLALDELGDVYIGDAGTDGDGATSSNPGFVVEVPYKGAAFQVPVNGVSIVFPQALAVNNATGALAIGDGGDETTAVGQVVEVPLTGSATVVSITNPAAPTNPTGLTFDAAGNLYVLDGAANTITEVYTNGTSALLSFATPSALSAPSAMASSAGSQSLVIANLGGGTSNNLVYLNGNSSTLAFGNQMVNTTSTGQSVSVANIGNQNLTLSNNYYSPKPVPSFPLANGTCAGGSYTSLTPCTLAFDFAPTATGAVSQTVKVNSNAYNSGTPVINLTGTGVKTQSNVVVAQTLLHPNRAGRKSFASTKSK